MIDFKKKGYAFNIIRNAAHVPTYVSTMFLSGDVITLDDLLNGTTPLDNAGDVYESSSVIGNLEDLNVEIVSVSRYSSSSVVESRINRSNLVLRFNTNNPLNSEVVAGPTYPLNITQCLVAFHEGHANVSGYNYTMFALCSVGVVGSGADIEVSDLSLDLGTRLHFSDLTLTF